MKKASCNRKFRNENGITLVEVIASIVILTIILLSAFQLFIQSAKTTETSENIIDATYIAQREMEKFYSESSSAHLPTELNTEIFLGYVYLEEKDGFFIYQNHSHSHYRLELQLKQNESYPSLTRIILKVIDPNDGTVKSQMETTLDWGHVRENI